MCDLDNSIPDPWRQYRRTGRASAARPPNASGHCATTPRTRHHLSEPTRKRSGSGRGSFNPLRPSHRCGHERQADRRTRHLRHRAQFRAAAVGARSQGVDSRDGCHVAAVDRATGSCGRGWQRILTPTPVRSELRKYAYSILIRRVTSARSPGEPAPAGVTIRRLPRSAILSSSRLSF
jgi:hypothetical protein